MKHLRILSMLLIAIALIGGAAVLTVPVPAHWSNDDFSFYVLLSSTIPISVIFVGAAVLFWMGLGGFTSHLKRAYGILCTGIALYGLAQAHVTYLLVFGYVKSWWMTSGAVVLPFVSAILAIYLGTRSFARLLHVKSMTASFWRVSGLATLLAIVGFFAPHHATPTPEVLYDSTIALGAWGAGFVWCTTFLLWRIKRTAGGIYVHSITWMFLAFVAMSAHTLHYLGAMLILGDESWYVKSGLITLGYVVVGFFFIQAALAFNAITVQQIAMIPGERDFFGRARRKISKQGPATALDVVMYAAQLVSNPRAIEGVLDDLRRVTAQLAASTHLGRAEEADLRKVYLEIEDYLVTKEPVRRFEREQLREHIESRLRPRPELVRLFWRG